MLAVDDARGRAATPPPVSSASSAGPAPRAEQARDLIRQASDPATGALDTKALGGWVADAAGKNPQAASEAHAAVEDQLMAQGRVGDLSRFNEDVVAAAKQIADATPNGLWAAGQVLANQGRDILVDNPILTKRWEPTTSAWTGKGGFTPQLTKLLTEAGIDIARINPSPAGSLSRSSGVPLAVANNTNGALARDAIAAKNTLPGQTVQTEVPRNGGTRVVDVVVDIPNKDPRMNQRIEIESKVGRTGVHKAGGQVAADAAALVDNRTLRQGGMLIEGAGKVLRPVGIAMDAIEIGSAFQKDGNKIGENTGRAASGVAGGALGAWGGAAAGAAIGTAILPVGGTIVGGLIGGAIGAFAGDQAGKGVFDTVKGWF
ncbi:MAG: hypothetical protein ABW220_07550 [Burkholderiaceae bacterium]